MCNFIDRSDPNNWSVGNPKLKTLAYNNFYLGYTFNKSAWNFNTDVFYSTTNNAISNLTFPVNDIYLTIPENISHSNSIGIDLSSWVSIKEKCDINLSSSIYHTFINASGLTIDTLGTNLPDATLKKKDYGFNVKLSTDIKLNKKTSANFYVNYFSREVIFQGYNFDYINSSISISRKFFKSSLLVTLGANNIFDNLMKHGSHYDYGGIIKTTNNYETKNIPAYFITLQYKFRQGDRGTKNSGGMQGGK